MGGFRLNKPLQIVMLAAAGIIIVAGMGAYSDYRGFEDDTRGYAGVTFEDTKQVVRYRLGDPDTVEDPNDVERGIFAGLAGRILVTNKNKDPDNAMPDGKSVEDYPEWGFDASNTNVEFDPKTGQVVEVSCTVFRNSYCPSLFGVQAGDTEPSVVAKLGKPTHYRFEGTTKYIRYADIGVDIQLDKEKVWRLSSSAPKGDRTAILKRYLKGKLSGFWGSE